MNSVDLYCIRPDRLRSPDIFARSSGHGPPRSALSPRTCCCSPCGPAAWWSGRRSARRRRRGRAARRRSRPPLAAPSPAAPAACPTRLRPGAGTAARPAGPLRHGGEGGCPSDQSNPGSHHASSIKCTYLNQVQLLRPRQAH